MAYSGGQITRLGLSGFPRAVYGSFDGRAETIVITPDSRIIRIKADDRVVSIQADDRVIRIH